MLPILIPLCWPPRERRGYVAFPPIPPPPLLQNFLPVLYLKVVNAMRRPFQAIYLRVRRLFPPL